jgi:hypothetical protein
MNMDVVDLLKNAPGLLEALQQTGVPQDKLSSLGGAIGDQLGGSDGFDLTDLLGGLDLDNFTSKINADSLAEQVGISPEIANQAIALIGPIIADFSPGNLGSIVGKLFD